jgi:nucleotide-binding universal stress UspA family protein
MFKTILVPLDGSDLAARALPYAEYVARGCHGRLVLFHATPSQALDGDSDAKVDTILEQDRLAVQLTRDGVPTTSQVVEGNVGPAIVHAADDLRADLVVMSTHGRGGVDRILHGSVADHVLHHVSIPTLMVTAACDRVWTPDRPLRLLIPLDGSAFAEAALGPAFDLLRSFTAELWLLRAAEERVGIDALGFAHREPASAADLDAARAYLEQVAAPFRRSDDRVAITVEPGSAEEAIARVVAREAIDLVVMATHGQGGLGRLLLERMATVVTAGRVPLRLGSVAAASVRSLRVPMLLVRPASVAQAGAMTPSASAPSRRSCNDPFTLDRGAGNVHG